MFVRRQFLRFGLGAATITFLPLAAWAQELPPFDMQRLKEGYLRRLSAIRKAGTLPVIDIESSYDPLKIDITAYAKSMDRAGVAQTAASVDQPPPLVKKGETWSHHVFEMVRAFPEYFIPTANGGNHPAWTMNPGRFLDDNEKFVVAHNYPMMGEFEVRHYPSPNQVEKGELFRDVKIPIDGPHGHRLFAFAEKTGIPFQIHYEIEDELLPPLEAMLTQYPGAKLIWCHLFQVRYAARAKRYTADYLRELFVKHPNLYVDTAFRGPKAVYKGSGEVDARIWAYGGGIRREWKALIEDMPYRFLTALDIGGDRMGNVPESTRGLRNFLDNISGKARDIVAYGSAWKLLFGEEIVG